jgi:hypothetical protein
MKLRTKGKKQVAEIAIQISDAVDHVVKDKNSDLYVLAMTDDDDAVVSTVNLDDLFEEYISYFTICGKLSYLDKARINMTADRFIDAAKHFKKQVKNMPELED